jgi:chemotaxis protein CheD
LENPISARFVNQAIVSLMTLMKIKKSDVDEIEVYVAGGANMMNQLLKTNKAQIGKFNLEAAWKFLAHYGFKVRRSNVGQGTGIKMIVNCTEGSVEFIRLEPIDYNAI